MTAEPHSVQSRTPASDPVLREFSARLRAALGSHLRHLVLFGSRARGDAGNGSDYDILIVVDDQAPSLRQTVLEVEVHMLDTHGALFASVLRSEEQWEQAQGFPLAMNIAREGLPL
jgi:predicted nucleotidyltransferase